MQIAIEIPEETYQDVLKNGFIYDEDNEVVTYAIKNGIPHESVTEFADRCRECGKRYVKRQTGHWTKDDITERSKSAYKHKCDRCGAYHRAMYDYCPSCGAKMEEQK